LAQYTALFAVVYIFVVIEVGSRRIVHVNTTTSPTLAWIKPQIREPPAEDRTPRFLVHVNDGIFGQYGRPVTVEDNGRKRSHRCHLDRWLGEVMEIEGNPIPFGALSASPFVERLVRTLREEDLNHFLFLTANHIRRVVAEYVRHYNGARPSQAIHGIPDPYPELWRRSRLGGAISPLSEQSNDAPAHSPLPILTQRALRKGPPSEESPGRAAERRQAILVLAGRSVQTDFSQSTTILQAHFILESPYPPGSFHVGITLSPRLISCWKRLVLNPAATIMYNLQ